MEFTGPQIKPSWVESTCSDLFSHEARRFGVTVAEPIFAIHDSVAAGKARRFIGVAVQIGRRWRSAPRVMSGTLWIDALLDLATITAVN